MFCVSEFFKILESCNMFREKNNIIKMIKVFKSGKMRVGNIRKVLIKNCKFLKMLITLKIVFYSLGNLSGTKFCRKISRALKSIIQKLHDFVL